MCLHENGDVFFQHREACNSVYNALPAVVEKYMAKINAKLGTNYDQPNYYGAADADRVIVAMGSICDVADEVGRLPERTRREGRHSSRSVCTVPVCFSAEGPAQNRQEGGCAGPHQGAGSLGEPLVPDVAATLREAGLNDVVLTGGRYGLGSKDTPAVPPSSLCSRSWRRISPRSVSPLGITDDVTFLSLPEVKPRPITAAAGTKECKF